MPISSLTQAAGLSARSAATCLVCFITIALTACRSESRVPSTTDRGDTGIAGTGANDAPIISGKPLTTAVVNVPYTFRPDVHDPDGDVLVFEVAGKPTWATFDPATGVLSGTPPAGTTGTYGGIVIFVSDGDLKTSLPSFSIKVTQSTATGAAASASLSWATPTQNVDGSPLTDLAGYRVHYGTSSSGLDRQVEIANPAATSTVIQGLTPGTWYFAISAYTKSGAESARSGTVSKVIG